LKSPHTIQGGNRGFIALLLPLLPLLLLRRRRPPVLDRLDWLLLLGGAEEAPLAVLASEAVALNVALVVAATVAARCSTLRKAPRSCSILARPAPRRPSRCTQATASRCVLSPPGKSLHFPPAASADAWSAVEAAAAMMGVDSAMPFSSLLLVVQVSGATATLEVGESSNSHTSARGCESLQVK